MGPGCADWMWNIPRTERRGKKIRGQGEEEREIGTESGATLICGQRTNEEKLKQAKRESNWHAPWQRIGKSSAELRSG